jgi:hypothetical protein
MSTFDNTKGAQFGCAPFVLSLEIKNGDKRLCPFCDRIGGKESDRN